MSRSRSGRDRKQDQHRDAKRAVRAVGSPTQREQKTASARQMPTPTDSPEELDHRGIRLPPRQRVGGIITPQ